MLGREETEDAACLAWEGMLLRGVGTEARCWFLFEGAGKIVILRCPAVQPSDGGDTRLILGREGGVGGSVWPWSTSVPWGYALDWSNQLCFRVSLQWTTLAARVGSESGFLYEKVVGGDEHL